MPPMGNTAPHLAPPPDWVTGAEAEKLSGRSRRQLLRLLDQGRVRRRKDERGKFEWERGPLERLADVPEAAAEGDLLDVARQFLQTMSEPMRLYVEHLQHELSRLTEQNGELLKLQVELVRAREQALSESFLRDAAAAELEAKEDRKNLALQKGMLLLEAIISEQHAGQLLKGLTDEQFGTLLEAAPAFLDAKQIAQLHALGAKRKLIQPPAED